MLNVTDLKNILSLMDRVTYKGISEVEVAIVLVSKIKAEINEQEKTPKPAAGLVD